MQGVQSQPIQIWSIKQALQLHVHVQSSSCLQQLPAVAAAVLYGLHPLFAAQTHFAGTTG